MAGILVYDTPLIGIDSFLEFDFMRQGPKRVTVIFAITMAILMAVTLFLPALTPDQPLQQVTVTPTSTAPPPTLPPPMTDFSGIQFDEIQLHPSGLFYIEVPSGWTVGNPVHGGNQARLPMNNPAALSVIEVSIEEPLEPIATMDELSALYTSATLASGWRTYSSWEELSRRRTDDDQLLIDYALVQNRQDYLARDLIWADDDWIYKVRVVVPANARDLLFFIIDAMSDHFYPLEQFKGTPVRWEGYFDSVDRHMLRHPETWALTDGAPGQPASFQGADGIRVRVEARDVPLADADDAAALVEGLRSRMQISDVEPVTHPGGEGYSVAYVYTDPDGERQHGMAILLAGNDARAHLVDALLPPGMSPDDAVENEDDEAADVINGLAASPYAEVVRALGTFSLLDDLDLLFPVEEEEEQVEVLPEVAPEVTPEATPEPDDDEDGDDEADAEETPEAPDTTENGDE
jgi:hypothetical protein